MKRKLVRLNKQNKHGNYPSLQGFKKPKQSSCFPNFAELDTKSLHFYKQVLDINDLIPDERLQEYANQANQTILHVLILDIFTRLNAVRDVQVYKFCWEFHCCCKPIDHFH